MDKSFPALSAEDPPEHRDSIELTTTPLTEHQLTQSNSQNANLVNVDDLLEHHVGACGLWQWAVVILCVLSAPTMSIFPVFANAVPDIRCKMEPSVEDTFSQFGLNFDQAAEIIMPKTVKDSGIQYGCSRLQFNWTDEATVKRLIADHLRLNGSVVQNSSNLSTEPCPFGYVYRSRPFQHPSTIVMDFNLVCNHAWIPPFGVFLFMIGMFVGYLLGGSLGDKYGRKPTAIGFSLVELVGAVVISTAPNHYVYHIGRMFVGITNTGKASVLRLLPIELTLAKYRGYFSAFTILGIAFFHQAIMVGVAYVVPQWRWINAICLMPGLISIAFFFLLPESPRWYNSQNRPDKALLVLRKGMRINHLCSKSPVDLAQWQLLEEKYSHFKPTGKSTAVRLASKPVSSSIKDRWRSIRTQTPNGELLKNLVVGMLLYFTQSLSYFGVLLYARVIHNSVYLVAFLNAATAIPGPVIAAILYRIFRYRRNPLMVCFLIILAALLTGSLYSIFVKPKSDIVLNVFCNCSLVLYAATMIMMSVYVAELFPSNVRTRAVGMTSAIGRLGSSLSTFVNQLDVYATHGVPILIYAGVTVLQMILLLIIKDTTGENLPDVSVKSGQTGNHENTIPDEDKLSTVRV
ncbi:unnamed protein product [Echinostoma caproni]|uniref:MFS domain-containing protein n=1 Tax=Echinostoma caproni TaxID=27848 RepID=A0A183A7N4_9TREM|nr:unnamed protein product [Echinostoma caproni]